MCSDLVVELVNIESWSGLYSKLLPVSNCKKLLFVSQPVHGVYFGAVRRHMNTKIETLLHQPAI